MKRKIKLKLKITKKKKNPKNEYEEVLEKLDQIYGKPIESRYLNLIRDMIQSFGKPLGIGGHRIAFYDNDNNYVIKIPYKKSGEDANEQEISRFPRKREGIKFARTKLHENFTNLYKIPIIIMEKVTPYYKTSTKYEDLPDWAKWYCDAAQVGYTKNGDLVAYDWEDICK